MVAVSAVLVEVEAAMNAVPTLEPMVVGCFDAAWLGSYASTANAPVEVLLQFDLAPYSTMI